MKALNIRLLFVLLCTGCLLTTSFAQQTETSTEKDGKKKIVIITKKVDDEGNVTTEKIVKEGEDAEVIFIGPGENEFEFKQEKDIDIEVEDNDGEKHMKFKIIRDGKPEVFEWRGEGEMPEEMKQQLEEKGMNINIIDGDHAVVIRKANHFNFRKPNACLGVRIGQKVEIENVNGEETQTETGFSEDGVPILGIIEDSGAEAAGLLAEDVITAINGITVEEMEDVIDALTDLEAGTTVSINYLRNGSAEQTNATLGDCGDVVQIEEIEKVIEMDGGFNFDTDENKMVIIKKRNGQADEIVEWNEETEIEESPVGQFQNTLELKALDVFPNPTKGMVLVQFEAPSKSTIVKVVDLSGKEIYKEELNNFDGVYNKELDLSKAAKGTLILSIQQGDSVFSEKLILQ
jgi:hypothetical protein